ncbi:MAG: hypothetical protein L0Y72_04395 [Gemmataceae bacterium]|nr:hypothetical protein [Gemmataceae bacterium]MCI0738260.1 hypothetical protein [Gemmataceae bacterium]
MSQGQTPQGWRGQSTPSAADPAAAATQGRSKKLVGLFTLLLAIVGSIIALFFYLRGVQEPEFLTMPIREYKSPWPVNALARQDSALLKERFPEHVRDPFTNVQEGDGVLTAIASAREVTGRPLVVQLCALARWRAVKDAQPQAAGVEGEVVVLPGDANPDRMDGIPLRNILAKIGECRAASKLLVLDIMRPVADVRLGVLADDIADKTHAALAAAEPKFFVLCACSPGQLSLVSNELDQSVFAYYLDQGLRGEADGFGADGKIDNRKKDNRITVMELAEFVKAHVDRWAVHNRGVRQTPVLLGDGADFTLVRFDPDAPVPASEAPPAVYPKWLLDGWKMRDKWRTELGRLGPGILRKLDADLLQAEQRWRGGMDDDAPAKDEGGRVKKDLEIARDHADEQHKRIAQSRPTPLRSLAAVDSQPSAVDLAVTLRFLAAKAFDPGQKLDDKDKAKKDELDKEVKKALEAYKKTPELAAKAVFETAAAMPKLGTTQVFFLHDVLRNLEFDSPVLSPNAKGGEGRFAETVLLERIKALADKVRDNDWVWPSAEMRTAMAATRTAEAALVEVARDPALFDWVKTALQSADEIRRSAEKELFAGLPNVWEEAGRRLQTAENRYKKVLQHAQSVREARAELDRALALLPDLGPVWIRLGITNALEERAWHAAVQEAQLLAAALQTPRDNGGNLEGTLGLRQILKDLERYYEEKVKRCLSLGEAATADDYFVIHSLLASARLDGPRRQDLWTAGQKLARQLLKDKPDLDKALPADLAWQKEVQRRKWRGRFGIDMLVLAGLTSAKKLETLYLDATAKNDDVLWRACGEQMAGAWSAPWSSTFKAPDASLPADRLTRLLSPYDWTRERSSERNHWSQNPALALHQKDVSVFYRWLKTRAQAESAALEPDSAFRVFYLQAAKQYGDVADAQP